MHPWLDVDVRLTRGAFALDARFTAKQGVVALFGTSGAGKTRLVNAIAGIVRPHAGHVRADGITLFDNAAGIDVPPERRSIGYVFQDARLFPHLTVRNNPMFGAQRAHERRDVRRRRRIACDRSTARSPPARSLWRRNAARRARPCIACAAAAPDPR